MILASSLLATVLVSMLGARFCAYACQILFAPGIVNTRVSFALGAVWPTPSIIVGSLSLGRIGQEILQCFRFSEKRCAVDLAYAVLIRPGCYKDLVGTHSTLVVLAFDGQAYL